MDYERANALADVTKERTLDAQGIKALRPEDLGFVALYEQVGQQLQDSIEGFGLSRASAERIERFYEQIETRFGDIGIHTGKALVFSDPAQQRVFDLLKANRDMLVNARAAGSSLNITGRGLLDRDFTL